jgi:hypothetical protein
MTDLYQRIPGVHPALPITNRFSAPLHKIPAIVIFVNGYRMSMPLGNIIREIRRDDKVKSYDVNDYWNDIDDQFQERLGDQFAFYADGDAPTLTAKNKLGFTMRKLHGRKAGFNLISQITKIKTSAVKNKISRKILWGDNADLNQFDIKSIPIDIVCHSMGFAYALGMVEVLQESGFNPERIYALAPENPGKGRIPSYIEESQQYGSGPDDPWYQQDRIAPQEPIPAVGNSSYIPDGIPKGPYDSHSVANYGWIFKLRKGSRGYVKPRAKN